VPEGRPGISMLLRQDCRQVLCRFGQMRTRWASRARWRT